MAQVLRMETDKKKLTLGEMKRFVTTAEQYGILMSDTVEVSSASGQVVFRKLLPEKTNSNRAVKSKKKAPPKKTSDSGKKKTIKPASAKYLKCPVCGNKKEVVKVAGVTALKAHVVKGEPCAGSGAQVVGSKVKV